MYHFIVSTRIRIVDMCVLGRGDLEIFREVLIVYL